MNVTGTNGTAIVALKVRTTPARIEIENARTRISVDSTKPRAEAGYRGWHDEVAFRRDDSKSALLSGVARVAREGDLFARPADNPDAFAEIASERLFDMPGDAPVGSGFIPLSPPAINIEFTPARIVVHPGAIEISYGRAAGGT
ncbi:MAG: hypothetical protein HRF49_08230 [bacterium]